MLKEALQMDKDDNAAQWLSKTGCRTHRIEIVKRQESPPVLYLSIAEEVKVEGARTQDLLM